MKGKIRGKKRNENVGVAKDLSTWPKIAGIRKERRREEPLPKINLKCCQVG